jgi:hypothetical protein
MCLNVTLWHFTVDGEKIHLNDHRPLDCKKMKIMYAGYLINYRHRNGIIKKGKRENDLRVIQKNNTEEKELKVIWIEPQA